jgi:hypothetical protein
MNQRVTTLKGFQKAISILQIQEVQES